MSAPSRAGFRLPYPSVTTRKTSFMQITGWRTGEDAGDKFSDGGPWRIQETVHLLFGGVDDNVDVSLFSKNDSLPFSLENK